MDDMKKAALWWVRNGFTVFPLEGKKPKRGFLWTNECTSDPAKVERLWTRHKGANIAVVCGKPSGNLLVIDLDIDEKTGTDGTEVLYEWEKEHGKLPDTMRVLTGGGGVHLYYHTDGRRILNKARVTNGVDLRYNGGYVVAPPSVHPDTGALYQIEEEMDGPPVIADADELVYKFIAKGIPSEAVNASGKLNEFLLGEPIVEGQRDWSMFRLACKLRNFGMGESGILNALTAENAELCQPPLVRSELKKITRSAMKYEPKDSYIQAVIDGEVDRDDGQPGAALETYSPGELDELDLKPPEMIIDDIMPVGVGILAAPSKAGKSWMVLDMGLSVADGRPFLGHRSKKCGVLYLALEDSFYRVADRISKITDGGPKPDGLRIAIKSQKTNTGLIEQLRGHMEEYPDTRLIIIDTLQMIRPPKGRVDAYEFDYNIMGKLRTIVVEYNVSMLLVHHTRKSTGFDGDPFENILGSTALQGATDFMYSLKQGKDGFDTLYGKGRDISNIELVVSMDWTAYRWRPIGTAEEVKKNKEWAEYLNNPITVTIKEMLDEVERSMVEPKAVTLKMGDLRKEVMKRTGEVVGTSARDFGQHVRKLDDLLLVDGIEHCYPQSTKFVHTFRKT